MNDPKHKVIKQLGIAALRLLDRATTGGVMTALYETGVPVGRALWEFVSKPHGLNWDLPYSQVYRSDLDRLSLFGYLGSREIAGPPLLVRIDARGLPN